MEANNNNLPPFYDVLKVAPGNYIPLDHMTYGADDPHAHLLPIKKIYEVNVDANYPYVDHSFKFKFLNWFYYFNARWIVDPLNRFRYGFKMRGKENITKNMDKLQGGALTI